MTTTAGSDAENGRPRRSRSTVGTAPSEEAPADLTAELDGLDVELGPASVLPEPVDPDQELRERVRALWMTVTALEEVWLGPELEHSSAELDRLVSASMPLAREHGLDWMGSWIHGVVLAGTIAAVQLPKIRRVRERVEAEAAAPAEPVELEDDDDPGPDPSPGMEA